MTNDTIHTAVMPQTQMLYEAHRVVRSFTAPFKPFFKSILLILSSLTVASQIHSFRSEFRMKIMIPESKRGQTNMVIKERPSKRIDYFSSLPIDIIICILSLLPFADWVSMSQVSRQWMSLWTHVQALNFDEFHAILIILERSSPCVLCGKVIDISDHPCLEHLIHNAKMKFMEQVNMVLQHHSGDTIAQLSFYLQHDDSRSYKTMIDSWVGFAMTRNIEELELDFIKRSLSGRNFVDETTEIPRALDNAYEFPAGQFEPKRLESLSLGLCIFRPSDFRAFASLYTLTLYKVKIMDFSIGDLVSRCPVLDDLSLIECVLTDRYLVCEQRIHINSLTVMYCMGSDGTLIPIDLAVPNLSIVLIEGYYIMPSKLREAASLDDVTISIALGLADSSSGNILALLLSDARNCRTLDLTSWCIQVLPTGNNMLNSLTYRLYNLEHLRLHLGFVKPELFGISCLLRSCPNLRRLTFHVNQEYSGKVNWGEHEYLISYIDNFDEDSYWESQNIPYECLQKSLIEVRIIGYTERAAELQIMKFLLKHGVNLDHILTQSPATGTVWHTYDRLP